MAFSSNTYTATLDIKRRTPHRPLIIEGDAGVLLDLSLTDDGAAMDITGLYARCVFRRSDGRTVLVSESDDPCPMTVTKATGKIVITVPRTCFRDGDNFLQVQILDGDPDSGTCLSSTFPLLLRAYNCLLTNEAVEESVEFPILEWLIDALRNMDVSITMVSPTTAADASLTLSDGAYHLALTIPKGAKIVDIDVVEGLQSYSMVFALDDGSIVSCAIPNWVTAEWVAAQNFVDSDGLASELLTYATKQYVTHAIANSGHYTKPSGGIPSTDMTSAVQASLALADSAYQMPNTGIPKSDLDYLVQVALERANNPAEMTGATASADGTAGIVPAPEAGDQGKYLKGNGTWAAVPVFTGASDSRGTAGLVPPPEIADVDKFLKGDGTWASAGGGGTSYTPLVVEYGDTDCWSDISAKVAADDYLIICTKASTNTAAILVDVGSDNATFAAPDPANTKIVWWKVTHSNSSDSWTGGEVAIPAAYTSTPAMDGTGAAGSSTAFAKGDHVHPTDTSRLATDGNAKDVTIKSTSTTPFTVIPNTAITFETLVNILAGWYYAINLKQDELTAGTGISISNGVISATGGGGLSADAKEALLALLAKVAYTDDDGEALLDDLEAALYGRTLESIDAVFTQGSAVIYDTDSLSTLRQYLVVTATYSDNTTATVTDYTLSGTLTEGTSTITASWKSKTDTFTVTVTAGQHALTGWDSVGTPNISNNILTCSDGNFIKTPEAFSPSSSNWKIMVKYRFTSSFSGYADVLGGVDNSNASCRTVLIEHQTSSMRTVALYSSSNGNAWDITDGNNFLASLPEGVTTYTWIWMSIEYDGTGYTLKYSLDGENYTTGVTKTSSSKVQGGYPVAFGLKRNGVLSGEIDLSECKIYIGGDLWWEAVAS